MTTQDQAPIYYRIDLDEDGAADTTEVTDPGLVEQLAAQTRTEETPAPATPAKAAPPPLPLGAEASAFADRVRYALMFQLGFGPDKVERVLDYARSLMPRGGSR